MVLRYLLHNLFPKLKLNTKTSYRVFIFGSHFYYTTISFSESEIRRITTLNPCNKIKHFDLKHLHWR